MVKSTTNEGGDWRSGAVKIVDPRKFTQVELLNTTEFRMAVVRGRKYHALF